MPIWGGGQEHILQVSRILETKYGCQVEIVAPTLVTSKFNFNKFYHRVWFAFWVLWFLLTSDYDLYHSHSFSTAAFLPIAGFRGKKTAITVHGFGENLIGGGILNKLKIPVLLRWLVLEVWPINYHFSVTPYKNFVTVGNGVNVKDFDKVRIEKDSKKFVIFWLGRKYDPVKGVSYLEKAIKKINNHSLFLDLGEDIYGIEKIKRFKQADLFVLPSLVEGFPIVILEAMAAKLPIVATDVGVVRSVIEKANCGIVVKPGSVVELSRGISLMSENRQIKELGKNGHDFVKDNYSWDQVADKTYEIYK